MTAAPFGSLRYQCNICGSDQTIEILKLDRESPSCSKCHSTPRYRAIIHILSTELFGQSMALSEFPVRKDISGLGLTDWERYATELGKKFNYSNTFLHMEPKLDITDIDTSMNGRFDFVIVSEVLEHVIPPVSVAFQNLRRLLKPNGFVVCSVPSDSRPGMRTKEHFPQLFKYELETREGKSVLINTTRSGEIEVFDQICFHGGPGLALEMRLFSEEGMIEEFRQAGFREITVYREPDFVHGVYWKEPWSKPIAARV